jgi:hypothetical protein
VYDHKNQKLQKPNIDCELAGSDGTKPYTGGPSIFLARLHVRIVGFQDIPEGDMYGMIWNPESEAWP